MSQATTARDLARLPQRRRPIPAHVLPVPDSSNRQDRQPKITLSSGSLSTGPRLRCRPHLARHRHRHHTPSPSPQRRNAYISYTSPTPSSAGQHPTQPSFLLCAVAMKQSSHALAPTTTCIILCTLHSNARYCETPAARSMQPFRRTPCLSYAGFFHTDCCVTASGPVKIMCQSSTPPRVAS